MNKRHILPILTFALAVLSFGGCSSMKVSVWERDILAKEEMQPDSHTLDRAMDDHVYFSKEASSGGRSFGGGGCGCN